MDVKRVQTTGQKCHKNVNILLTFRKFYDHIWDHHEKYIQISTNIPGIGSLIRFGKKVYTIILWCAFKVVS